MGKKAVVVGAVAQTIPDIDTVSALWLDPASSVVSHRFLTHSISFAISVAI
ncbi:MAG: metal-dependent hydrolase, partial [Flammeovirgaceae bacterium]